MGVIYSKVSDYVFGDYDFEYYNNIESKQQEVKSDDNENSVKDKLSHPVSLNEDTLHLLRFLAEHGVDVKHTTCLIEQLYARHRRMQYHYLIDVLTNQTQLYEPFQKTKVTVDTLMRQRFMAVDKKKDYNQECTQHTFDSNISTIIGIVAKAAAGDLGQIFVALLGDIQKAKLFEKKCKTTGWNDGQLGIIDVQWNDTNNGIILFEIAKISIKLTNKSKKALSIGGELEKVEIDAMYMSASAELKKLFPDDEERKNIVKIMKSSVTD